MESPPSQSSDPSSSQSCISIPGPHGDESLFGSPHTPSRTFKAAPFASSRPVMVAAGTARAEARMGSRRAVRMVKRIFSELLRECSV